MEVVYANILERGNSEFSLFHQQILEAFRFLLYGLGFAGNLSVLWCEMEGKRYDFF